MKILRPCVAVLCLVGAVECVVAAGIGGYEIKPSPRTGIMTATCRIDKRGCDALVSKISAVMCIYDQRNDARSTYEAADDFDRKVGRRGGLRPEYARQFVAVSRAMCNSAENLGIRNLHDLYSSTPHLREIVYGWRSGSRYDFMTGISVECDNISCVASKLSDAYVSPKDFSWALRLISRCEEVVHRDEVRRIEAERRRQMRGAGGA